MVKETKEVLCRHISLYLAILTVVVGKYLLLRSSIHGLRVGTFLIALVASWFLTMVFQVVIVVSAHYSDDLGAPKLSSLIKEIVKGMTLLAAFYWIVLGFLLGSATTVVSGCMFVFENVHQATSLSLFGTVGVISFVVITTSLLAFVLPSVILDGSVNPFVVSYRFAKKNLKLLIGINTLWYAIVAASAAVESFQTKWERASLLGAHLGGAIAVSAIEKGFEWDKVIHVLRVVCPVIGSAVWVILVVFLTLLYKAESRLATK